MEPDLMKKIIIALILTVALLLAAYMILISVSLAASPVRPRPHPYPHHQQWRPYVHRRLPCVACVHLQRV